jgi:hypothetical protein
MMKNDMIQTTEEDLKTPIIGAAYLWQGQPVTVREIRASELNPYTWDAKVEYFSKAGKCYLSLWTPWLPGSFLLTFKPGGQLSRV